MTTTTRYARPDTWLDTPDYDAVVFLLGDPHSPPVETTRRLTSRPPVTGPQPAVRPRTGATAVPWPDTPAPAATYRVTVAPDDDPTDVLTLPTEETHP